MLLGFARPSAGRILIDGDDLATLDLETWRAQVGWVPQQPYLFPGTVAANIRLGWPMPRTRRSRTQREPPPSTTCRLTGW